MLIISGSSEETIMIDIPLAASWSISAYISDFVFTSTPLVGSSNISTDWVEHSHLPINTFCWFPPLSFPTTCSGPVTRICISFILPSTMPSSACLFQMKCFRNLGTTLIVVLNRTPDCKNNPCSFLLSGTMPNPLAMASLGFLKSTSLPLNLTVPRTFLLIPKRHSTVSLLPAPTRPDTPRISPFLRSKLTFLTILPSDSSFTSRTTSSFALSFFV